MHALTHGVASRQTLDRVTASQLHLQMARRLLADHAHETGELVFEAVTHFNATQEPLPTEDEMLIARLNTTACERLRRTGNWEPALRHARIAWTLLSKEDGRGWRLQYDLTLKVVGLLGELEFQNGNPKAARDVLDLGVERAHEPTHRARLIVSLVLQAMLQADAKGSIEPAVAGLRSFGQELPMDNISEAYRAEMAAIVASLDVRRFRALMELKEAQDERMNATLVVLDCMMPPLMRMMPELWQLVCARYMRLMMQHGHSRLVPASYALGGE